MMNDEQKTSYQPSAISRRMARTNSARERSKQDDQSCGVRRVFWILDLQFWIEAKRDATTAGSSIQNPKSKMNSDGSPLVSSCSAGGGRTRGTEAVEGAGEVLGDGVSLASLD